MAKKTAAPSGCKIIREGNKYTLSWKIKAKNSSDGQKRRYRTNKTKKGKWIKTEAIKKTATSTAVVINDTTAKSVTIQVQDNQDKSGKKVKDLSASAWKGATFSFETPPLPIVNVSLDDNYWNRCIVSWGHRGGAFNNKDKYGFIRYEYQTIFHDEKTADSWPKDNVFSTTKSETGSFPVQETTVTIANIQNIGYVRKYRFRTAGRVGHTTWVTGQHYYSTPYGAEIKEATIKESRIEEGGWGGIDCYVKWYSRSNTFHPIDYTVVQYGIAVPGANMTCPSDISWSDRPTMLDTGDTKDKNGNIVRRDDSDFFPVDSTIPPDYCLFARVINVHDNNKSYSVPAMATGLNMIPELSEPSGLNIPDPDWETYRIIVNVTNESAVPDSNIAVVFRSIKGADATDQIIGIIPHGVESMTLQCPNWDSLDEWSIGVFAFVGDYGEYSLSDDTSVVSGKRYYTRTGSEAVYISIVSPTGNPHESDYYEHQTGGYFLSDDTEVDDNKTYYTYTPAVPYTYTYVSNPSGNPHNNGYYELIPELAKNISFSVEQSGVTNTYTYTVYEIPDIKMQSKTVWRGGDFPRPPANVKVVSPREGVALVTWDWAWNSADSAELSWSDHEDAWESTDQPEVYRIANTHAGKWSIYGLEMGVTWYIRVRLIKTTEGGDNPGPWSTIEPLDMTAAPNIPVLESSKRSVTHSDTFTLSWNYESNDGTDQKDAYLKLVTVHDDGTPPTYSDANLVNNIGTLRSVDLIPDNLNWETGQQYNIALSVLSESQKQSEWSMPVPIAVADPLECSVTSTSFDTKNLYSITTDTEINEAQTYYTLVGTEVQDPVIDDILTYYELVDGVYTRTEDGVIDTEKTYYTVVGTVVQDPQEESLSEYYIRVTYNILKQMPITLSASVTGGLENKFYTNVSIERAAPYFVDRPDETTYSGYEGETVYSDIVGNPASITITQNDLAGYLDDSALYYLNVYAFDDLDQVSAAEPILFMVEWEHQAPVPTAVAEFDPEYSVVKITPSIDPEKYEEGDTFDIYRLSIDKPVLIVKGGTYDSNGVGQTYVDPYPTIGESGGHRVVTVTANGDFIANDEETDMAWVDLDADDGDIFRHDFSIINSGEGRFEILYNADLSTNWQKDFKETKYLGGHIQGDWNAGIHRDSTINSVVLRNDDIDTETAFRRLAEYPGICHVRTLDGSNYYADVQVNESIPYDDTPTTSYSFKITRVDSEGYDGIELSEWNKLISG